GGPPHPEVRDMAKKQPAAPALDQRMELVRIRRPLHGWGAVYSARYDPRLHVVAERGLALWHFGVSRLRWRWARGAFEHRAGPFGRRPAAERAARRWFLDNPVGVTAELLARHPHNPGFRALLLAMNGGDLDAALALPDLCEETGAPGRVVDAVEHELLYLGVWPAEENSVEKCVFLDPDAPLARVAQPQ